MLEFLNGFAATTHHAIRVRIGIHSGPVVAGSSDGTGSLTICGRHGQHGEPDGIHGIPGRIHVSSAVAERLKESTNSNRVAPFRSRDWGNLNTLFLNGRCPR